MSTLYMAEYWWSTTTRMAQAGPVTAAGIGRVTLVRIENGEQSPRYETLVALAGALGRPVADLITGEPARAH